MRAQTPMRVSRTRNGLAVSACQRRHDAGDADGHRPGFPAGRRVEAGLVAVARLTVQFTFRDAQTKRSGACSLELLVRLRRLVPMLEEGSPPQA